MIATRIAKLLEVAPGGETDDWGEEISTDHNLYQVHDCDDDDSGDGDGDDGDSGDSSGWFELGRQLLLFNSPVKYCDSHHHRCTG